MKTGTKQIYAKIYCLESTEIIEHKLFLQGPIPSVIVFFYITNQKIVLVKPQGLDIPLGEIRQFICVFCDCMFTSQMALSFYINIITEYT